MIVKTTSNRFITSSLDWYAGFYQQLIGGMSSLQELGNGVVKIAEQAQAFRQYDRVREAAQILANIPIGQYQSIGHYYLGLCELREGKSPIDIFEQVAEEAPTTYRVRAMHSLAAMEARTQDYDSELAWLVESLKVHPSIDSLRGIAIVKAKEGDHRHALKDLERFYPLARHAPPHIYFAYLNSLAIELGEAGRKYEARNVIRHVLESPFIIAYPEWRETAEDLKGPNRSFAVLKPTRQRRAKILSMPVIEHAEPTQWHKPAQVISLATWKAKMSDKGDELDGRELLLKVVELSTHPGMTDGKLLQVIQYMYKLLIEFPKPDDDGDEPGA